MKNLTVYVGTIKRVLDLYHYNKHGEETCISIIETKTSKIAEVQRNTKDINKQAILIKTKSDHIYQFKLSNTFKDNMRIIFDLDKYAIPNKPKEENEIFYDEETLVPYYNEQPKRLNLRKLRKDLLFDARIKTGIDH